MICELWASKLQTVRQQVASLSTVNCKLQANRFEGCEPTSLWDGRLQVKGTVIQIK